MMGSEGNILETVAENARLIRIKNPILSRMAELASAALQRLK